MFSYRKFKPNYFKWPHTYWICQHNWFDYNQFLWDNLSNPFLFSYRNIKWVSNCFSYNKSFKYWYANRKCVFKWVSIWNNKCITDIFSKQFCFSESNCFIHPYE
jgi:hypothetical protein